MNKLLISILLIGMLIIPCFGFTLITGQSIPDDKVMHFEFGYGLQALFEHKGYTPNEARTFVFLIAIGKECYDTSVGGDIDSMDILATMLGSYTWNVTDGVTFGLRIGR